MIPELRQCKYRFVLLCLILTALFTVTPLFSKCNSSESPGANDLLSQDISAKKNILYRRI